uniref:NAC domain-containing protein n=1 Tax=Oryza glaberrima TaxID=4538 RepID=I1PH22_ORYGL
DRQGLGVLPQRRPAHRRLPPELPCPDQPRRPALRRHLLLPRRRRVLRPTRSARRRLAPAPGTGDGDGRVWYVFTPVRVLGSRGARKARTVGGGGECWHAEGGPKDVKGSAAGGKLQKFSYKIKTASGAVVKPGWLMVEFSFPGSDHLALCKVYRSPRTSRYGAPSPPSSAASSPSRAAPPPVSSTSGRKRKAEESDHPEAPASSAPRRTLPAPEQHVDVDAAAASEPDQGGYLSTDQLDSVAAFVQEHEGDEEFYKSLGFDERSDPQCWTNFFLSALEEFGPAPETDAAAVAVAAVEPGPCPEYEEHDDTATTAASSHAYDSATAELVNLSDKEFYDIIFSGDQQGGAAVAG